MPIATFCNHNTQDREMQEFFVNTLFLKSFPTHIQWGNNHTSNAKYVLLEPDKTFVLSSKVSQ